VTVTQNGLMGTEIERKFLIAEADRVPQPDRAPAPVRMRQGYLADEGDVSVRLRITADDATVTIKGGAGLRRTEVELPLPRRDAEALWLLTEGRRLEKVRHRVPTRPGGPTADVDMYEGGLAGLVTAEVEFESEDDAAAFVPPEWFDRELTGDGAWANTSLARRGRPPG
jgi:CYTH domain-containing protein